MRPFPIKEPERSAGATEDLEFRIPGDTDLFCTGTFFIDKDYNILGIEGTIEFPVQIPLAVDSRGKNLQNLCTSPGAMELFKKIRQCHEKAPAHDLVFQQASGKLVILHSFRVRLSGERIIVSYNKINCPSGLGEMEKERIRRMEDLLMLVTVKIKGPLANLVSLTGLMDLNIKDASEMKKYRKFIRNSVLELENYTKELDRSITDIKYHMIERDH